MYVVEEQLVVLQTENLELKEKIKKFGEMYNKGQGETSSLQLELQTSLIHAETILALALDSNNHLDRHLV